MLEFEQINLILRVFNNHVCVLIQEVLQQKFSTLCRIQYSIDRTNIVANRTRRWRISNR